MFYFTCNHGLLTTTFDYCMTGQFWLDYTGSQADALGTGAARFSRRCSSCRRSTGASNSYTDCTTTTRCLRKGPLCLRL